MSISLPFYAFPATIWTLEWLEKTSLNVAAANLLGYLLYAVTYTIIVVIVHVIVYFIGKANIPSTGNYIKLHTFANKPGLMM